MGACLRRQQEERGSNIENTTSIDEDRVWQIYGIGFNMNGEFGINDQQNHRQLIVCNSYEEGQQMHEDELYDRSTVHANRKPIAAIHSLKDFTVYTNLSSHQIWIAGLIAPYFYARLTAAPSILQRGQIEVAKICSTVHSNRLFCIDHTRTAWESVFVNDCDPNKRLSLQHQCVLIAELKDAIDIQSTCNISYALCGFDDIISVVVRHWYPNHQVPPQDVMNLIIIMYQGGINVIYEGRPTPNGPHLQCKKGQILSNKNIVKIACQKHVALFLDSTGIVWTYDARNNTAHSMEYFMRRKIAIHDIKCGENYSIAMDKDGFVYSFGCGTDGQLGHGDLRSLSQKPKRIETFVQRNESVTQIQCGRRHCLAKTQSGRYYLWGANYYNACLLSMHDAEIECLDAPHCLQDSTEIAQLLNEKQICNMSLGGSNTKILLAPKKHNAGHSAQCK